MSGLALDPLARALEPGHYLRTPADDECPSGVWLLIPLKRCHVTALDKAGAQNADLEGDELELDHDDEPSLGSLDRSVDQECWSDGISPRWQPDLEEIHISDRLLDHPKLSRFHRL